MFATHCLTFQYTLLSHLKGTSFDLEKTFNEIKSIQPHLIFKYKSGFSLVQVIVFILFQILWMDVGLIPSHAYSIKD